MDPWVSVPIENATQPAIVADAALASLNIEYHSKRSGDRLANPRCVLLSPGTLDRAEESIIRQRNGHSEQYKHQYLLTEVISEAT